jgi:hypothetical protein
MRSDARRFVVAPVAAIGLLLAVAGCARTVITDSAADKFPSADAELQFWEQLETQPVVTNNDALHGLILLADGQDPAQDYDQRVAAARQRGWLGSSEPPPAHESATMGMISVAVCEILDIKGGITMRVFGLVPRYCTRELVFLRYVPPRTDNQSISGLEFMDLMSRVEQQMPQANLKLPAEQAGPPLEAPALDGEPVPETPPEVGERQLEPPPDDPGLAPISSGV